MLLLLDLLLAASHGLTDMRRPPNPTNITMYNLRPASYEQDLRNKN